MLLHSSHRTERRVEAIGPSIAQTWRVSFCHWPLCGILFAVWSELERICRGYDGMICGGDWECGVCRCFFDADRVAEEPELNEGTTAVGHRKAVNSLIVDLGQFMQCTHAARILFSRKRCELGWEASMVDLSTNWPMSFLHASNFDWIGWSGFLIFRTSKGDSQGHL